MLLVGLTGSMGCGKSTVAALLSKHGGQHVDFDQLAREVTEPDSPGWEPVVNRFGREILTSDGVTIDRRKLGALVSDNETDLNALEALLHPLIWRRAAERLSQCHHHDADAIVILEVPLLFESNAANRFDLTVTVTCGSAQRKRLALRGQMDTIVRQRMLSRQLDEKEKEICADWVIDNSHDMETVRRCVDRLWLQLLKIREERERDAWSKWWRGWMAL